MIKDPDKAINKIILSQVKKHPFSILDIGCGNGRLTENIARNSSLAVGIEPYIQKAEEFPKLQTQNLFFAAGSGQKLCFKDKSFDMVLFCQSLHHIDESMQAHALEEALRVLKKQGILLIIEPMYNQGLYGQITALINTEKRLKEKAREEIKKLDQLDFEMIFHKNIRIEFLIDDYNDFFYSKIKNKPGINWNKKIEIQVKKIISRAAKKNQQLSIDNYLDVFCFKKISCE